MLAYQISYTNDYYKLLELVSDKYFRLMVFMSEIIYFPFQFSEFFVLRAFVLISFCLAQRRILVLLRGSCLCYLFWRILVNTFRCLLSFSLLIRCNSNLNFRILYLLLHILNMFIGYWFGCFNLFSPVFKFVYCTISDILLIMINSHHVSTN